MTVRFNSSAGSRVAIVKAGPFFSDDRVLVYEDAPRARRPGLLTVHGLVTRHRPVWVHSSNRRVPENAVALGEPLATGLDLSEGSVIWQLDEDVPIRMASEICLESTVESEVDDILERLSNTADIADKLLYVPGRFRPRSLRLNIDGDSFVVRDVRPRPADGAVMRISTDTRVTATPPINSGSDIVILADCSGSMAIDDVPVAAPANEDDERPPWMPPRRPRWRGRTRMEELQRALLRMLQARCCSPANGSKTALIGFTRDWSSSYPEDPDEGMLEISEETPPDKVREFQEAIWGLAPRENACTRISKGLYLAADVLGKFASPNNRKLVVLVSDGAETIEEKVGREQRETDAEEAESSSPTSKENPAASPSTRTILRRWRPVGAEDRRTGQLNQDADDPLLATRKLHELHDDLELRAYPISSEETYERWCIQNNYTPDEDAAEQPNHLLLKRLELRDADSQEEDAEKPAERLEDLFADLGNGVAEPVDIRPPQVRGLDSPEDHDALAMAADRLRAAGPETEHAKVRRTLVREIRLATKKCNEIAKKGWQAEIFDRGAALRFLDSDAEMHVCNRVDYHYYMLELAKGFIEKLDVRFTPTRLGRLHEDGRYISKTAFDVPAVEDAFKKGDILWDMRHHVAHWKEGVSPPRHWIKELLNNVDEIPRVHAKLWQEFQEKILNRLKVYVLAIQSALEQSVPTTPRKQGRTIFFVG